MSDTDEFQQKNGSTNFKTRIDDFLEELNEICAPVIPDALSGADIVAPAKVLFTPASSEAAKAWKIENQKRYEENHSVIAKKSAGVSREKYKAERAAEGKNVRQYEYHEHAPQAWNETREAYDARLHRDRQRAYRGVNPETVKPRADLSGMSDEEKHAHKSMQAKERKQAERERKRQAKTSD